MSIIDKLKSLGSAEEFFEVLQVEYQPEVLQVLRLHILRRMGQYLVSAEFDGMSEDEIYAAAQTMLGRPMRTSSSPIPWRSGCSRC